MKISIEIPLSDDIDNKGNNSDTPLAAITSTSTALPKPAQKDEMTLEHGATSIGEPFVALIDGNAWQGQLLHFAGMGASGMKALKMKQITGGEGAERIITGEEKIAPIVQRFSDCKSLGSLHENPAYWDDYEDVVKGMLQDAAHPAFSAPMTLQEANQRRAEIRRITNDYDELPEGEEDRLFDEKEALELRLSLTMPQTMDDFKAVMAYMRQCVLYNLNYDDEIDGRMRQKLNIIDNIERFTERLSRNEQEKKTEPKAKKPALKQAA